MASMLEEGGLLVIFHTSGRKEINAFHRRAHPVVARDLLPEAETIGRWMRGSGLKVQQIRDEEEVFYVAGSKLRE
jgi:hypothetical protein